MANNEAVNNLLSMATVKNWGRLGCDKSGKLLSRANKRLSQKYITPLKYVEHSKNIEKIQNIASFILERHYTIADSIYSLALNLLSYNGILHLIHVQTVLSEYKLKQYQALIDIHLPHDEPDILGSIYQCLLPEGEKNCKGSYFTASKITENMTADLDFSMGQTFLDPCCGSGAFLLALKNVHPNQIFGIDNDEVATFIAKVNLLLKYKNIAFIPHIFTFDYLDNSITNQTNCPITKFDYIVTNPPWGALVNKSYNNANISSRETFASFFLKAYSQLNENGKIRFLFPVAILNVKSHKELRRFIIESKHLQYIRYYDNEFEGVTTKSVSFALDKSEVFGAVKIYKDGYCLSTPLSAFSQTTNLVFSVCTNLDSEIIEQLKIKCKYNLANSIWALGIVTGNNKNKLKKIQIEGYEKIYTGKEIIPYRLKEPKYFILFDRKCLQQVAKEEYYRAKEKLVYKFISNRLVFAYDNSGALFLNSANILIPNIPNMSIKTVMAFLNSELYQYLYITLFSEIKVLKGNLMQLPFPQISNDDNEQITKIVQQIIDGDSNQIETLQDRIYNIFNITQKQKIYIKEIVYGSVS